jgi:hypothetical protein
MTTKTITGTYNSGYTLGAAYSELIVSHTARVYGAGVTVNSAATVVNYGTIQGATKYGVDLEAGGAVTNGSASDTTALISGPVVGVLAGYDAASVTNYGTIQGGKEAGVNLYFGGGSVTNGSATDTTALISGGWYGVITDNPATTITNYGTIQGDNVGVRLSLGGRITNGSATDTTALISGGDSGLTTAASTVTNFGAIEGVTDDGIFLYLGRSVINGSAADTTALISGHQYGVLAEGAAATITNDGTIVGIYGGVCLDKGGAVTNGSAADTAASIGADGFGVIARDSAATITNYGFIQGIALVDGGAVTNGSATDTTALITGSTYGLGAVNATATVTNFGSIEGSSAGIYLYDGGSVTNGSATDTTALVYGVVNGVDAFKAAATVVNFGAIRGADYLGDGIGEGVELAVGGSVINGSASDVTALIDGGYFGVQALAAAATIANDGTIRGGLFDGVDLAAGGAVTNGSASDTTALITGASYGVYGQVAATTISNFATIHGNGAGVGLTAGGSMTNGSAADTKAMISAGGFGVVAIDVAATIANYGTIQGFAGGVVLKEGGSVNNGSASDATALIDDQHAGFGVLAQGATATVINYGTVQGAVGGVYLYHGGAVTNGSSADTKALISGAFDGVYVSASAASVVNFATIRCDAGDGIDLNAGGQVTNGSASDTTALISTGGRNGVAAYNAAATVVNFGTIQGAVRYAGSGVILNDGGSVTNGSASDTKALISSSSFGVGALNATATVTNFGAIYGSVEGVNLEAGGALTNGSATDAAALIGGGAYGVDALYAAETVTNFGTVQGTTGAGIGLAAGGSVTNGSAKDTTALISGVTYGVRAFNAAAETVANFGTISGGTGVRFVSAGDRLIVEAGSKLIGGAVGGGGTLELASGGGAISGLGLFGTISGAAVLNCSGFGAYQIDGGVWTMSGGDALASGAVLDAKGATSKATTTLGGSLANAGVVEATTAAGLILSGMTVTNAMGTVAYAGGAVVAAAGSKITLEGADITGGTVATTGSGKIVTGAGVNTLDGSASSVILPTLTALTVSDNTGLTLIGAIANSGKISLSAATHQAVLTIGGSGATLSGAGAVTLGANAGNMITGLSGATLTNVNDKITGAGAIGGGTLTLVNQTGGLIEQTGAVALTIDTGANTITNAGTIEATGAGGLTIKSAIANAGLIEAAKGNVTITGAVTGTGSAEVSGATLDFAAGFGGNVKFSGKTGVLELADATSYAGTISGFSKTGTTTLDLADIAYVAETTKASYSGTTKGGVLTVTDGTNTATLDLTGNYLASTWTLSSDGHGGTDIVDPTARPSGRARSPASTHGFVQTMAGIAPRAHAAACPGADVSRPPTALLARPGTHLA